MKNIKASLCSVPVEGWGVRLDRKRSQAPLGIMPKVAIVSLVTQMKRAGFPPSSYDFYDIDMLYPSDDEIRKYFSSYKPNVVGLSAVVSTSYSQIKRISTIIRSELPDCWIVMGGNLSAKGIKEFENDPVWHARKIQGKEIEIGKKRLGII